MINTQKKKDNNNNFQKVTTIFKRSQFSEQETLFGMPKIKKQYRLNKNQFHLLGIFILNIDAKISRNMLYQFKSHQMHINTISNFLKEAELNCFIEKCKTIRGTIINNAYFYQKYPDTFEDGRIVKDKRAIYYQITKLGKKIFEVNEKLK